MEPHFTALFKFTHPAKMLASTPEPKKQAEKKLKKRASPTPPKPPPHLIQHTPSGDQT